MAAVVPGPPTLNRPPAPALPHCWCTRLGGLLLHSHARRGLRQALGRCLAVRRLHAAQALGLLGRRCCAGGGVQGEMGGAWGWVGCRPRLCVGRPWETLEGLAAQRGGLGCSGVCARGGREGRVGMSIGPPLQAWGPPPNGTNAVAVAPLTCCPQPPHCPPSFLALPVLHPPHSNPT